MAVGNGCRCCGLPARYLAADDCSLKPPCGSWLASDGGVSGTDIFGCADVIAGKPAPTGLCVGQCGCVSPAAVSMLTTTDIPGRKRSSSC
ncbi:hypothetical protein FCH79_22370 [Pseudomonas koreensis]|nr:hypothetical protein [Pseudomonas koreensis]